MIGHELAVKQGKAAGTQPGDQPDQRHFRCIAHRAEHAFAEKRPALRQPVKPADEYAVVPAFDTVGQAALMKCHERIVDVAIDPGVGPA